MFSLTRLLIAFLAKLQARTIAGAMKRKQLRKDLDWAISASKSYAQRKFTARALPGLAMMRHISDGYTRAFREYDEKISKGADNAEKLSEQIENVGKLLSHASGLEERKRESARGRLREREEKAGKVLNRVLALVAVLAAIPLLVGQFETSALASAFPWSHLTFDFPSFGLYFSFWTAFAAFVVTIIAVFWSSRRKTAFGSEQTGRVARVDGLSRALFDGFRGYEHPGLARSGVSKVIAAASEGQRFLEDSSESARVAREAVNTFDLKLARTVAEAVDLCSQWNDAGPHPQEDEDWAEYMEKRVCGFVLLSDVYDLRPEMLHLPVTLGFYRFMYVAGRLKSSPVSDHEFDQVMMSYGYSQEEIAGIHEWVVEGDRTESTAVKFVEAYVEAGIDALHKTDLAPVAEAS